MSHALPARALPSAFRAPNVRQLAPNVRQLVVTTFSTA